MRPRTRRETAAGLGALALAGVIAREAWRQGVGSPFRVVRGPEGRAFLRTPGGHYAAVLEADPITGTTAFVDGSGNLYVDSGNAGVGFTRVAPDGSAYSYAESPGGGWEEHYVGNIDSDLVELQVGGGAGARVGEGEVEGEGEGEVSGMGRLLGWRSREPDGEAPPLCRPNGPTGELSLCVDKDGNRLEGQELEYPPFLDEKELTVNPRRRLLGNSSGGVAREDLDINTFSQGKVPNLDLGLDP